MKNIFIHIILISTLVGCGNEILDNNYDNTITGNYEALWNEFDIEYGAFIAKNIDWDSLKTVYGSSLTDQSTDRELYTALCGLIAELNDGHVDLYAPVFGYYASSNKRNKSYYADTYSQYLIYDRRKTVIENHLQKGFITDTISDWVQYSGIIDYKGKEIGYINIPSFDVDRYNESFIQNAIDSFNKLDGVVIDLRFNAGGDLSLAVKCLNSFASERKLFLKAKFRNGPSHDDFTEMYDSWITPHDNCLKNKPVAVMTNSLSCSGAEIFTLGMKTQSNVITVGDTTWGALSIVRERILPNGWKYRTCSQVVYNPDGSLLINEQGNYLEGIGIAPDYYAPDFYYRFIGDEDVALDSTMEKLSEMIQSK